MSPSENALLNNRIVSFSWIPSTSDDVGEQILKVSTGADVLFERFVLVELSATATTANQIDVLQDGTFFWLVAARDGAGNFTFSSVGTFSVDTQPPGVPALVAPGDNAFLTTSQPLFQWDAPTQNGPFDYRLQVVVAGGDFDAGSHVVDSGDLTQTQFQSPVVLADGDYQWRVIASDAAKNATPLVCPDVHSGHSCPDSGISSGQRLHQRQHAPV